MKKTVFKKLRSNDGASLMLALLFFVVCAVVGSIFLTAATVAAGRVRSIDHETEVSRTVFASTNMIAKNLENNLHYQIVDTEDAQYSDSTIPAIPSEFSDVIKKMIEYSYRNHNYYKDWNRIPRTNLPQTVNLTDVVPVENHGTADAYLSRKMTINDGSLRSVKVEGIELEITIYENYDIKINASSTEYPDISCNVWLVASADHSEITLQDSEDGSSKVIQRVSGINWTSTKPELE